MIIPDVIIAMQLRNAAGVLDNVAKDGRLFDTVQGQLLAVARNLRDAAAMIEKLPPFEPD